MKLIGQKIPPIKKSLRWIKRKFDPLIGKYIDRLLWKYRHNLRKDWMQGYVDDRSNEHPHRKLLFEVMTARSIPHTVFEFGTGCGANLIYFSKYTEVTEFHGIDINERAIQLGKDILNRAGISNIKLEVGDIRTLKRIKDKSYDYVFTDAVLMYLEPKMVEIIIEELIRIAKFGILLCEQHQDESYYQDHWRHDYITILDSLHSRIEYMIRDIPQDRWDSDWLKYGKIFDIKLKD